ncbi:TetR/AcrR family transcriptional regulator [Dactylosporangium sp. CA-092794]|uniref:TetR/AcrR family transcriptional regulator n=1 Tax=Dactylosporangium sp. CA-092794 TaxID=3239929 RepID=UPI003D8EE77D
MVRWEPGAPERLQKAALELFATRGFEQTTATEIAQSVGLTERTFFRHFSDKREVFFHGQERLVDAFVEAVAAAPAGADPMEVVVFALQSTAPVFFSEERRPFSRMRQSVIEKNPALQEREHHKLGTLAEAMAGALRARGVDELTAALAARSGITVFGLAFLQWIDEGESRSLAEIEDEMLARLRLLISPAASRPAGRA